MPWTSEDAKGHTHHADSDKKKRQWAHVANSALKAGHSEASAIRQANAAVHPMQKAEITAKVIEFLSKNAPHIAQLVEKESTLWREDADGHYRKDMTAGDTHVTTALGNEKDSKKVSTAYLQDDEDEKKNGKVVQAEDCAPATIKAEFDLKITKLDSEQQKVFGWAYVCQRGDYLVVDKQGDMILPADMETAAHEYALHWRSQGNMHKLDENGTPVPHGRLIESIVFTPEKMDKAGIKATDPETGQPLYGWFVGFKVDDPTLWEAHKRGERPEFSIGGRGRRVEVSAE